MAASDSSKEVEDVNNHDVDMDLDSTGENRNLEEVSDDKENNDLDSEMEDMYVVANLETAWEPPQDRAPQEDAGSDEPVGICSDTSNLDEEESYSDILPPNAISIVILLGMAPKLKQL